jgi:hypothetical protein
MRRKRKAAPRGYPKLILNVSRPAASLRRPVSRFPGRGCNGGAQGGNVAGQILGVVSGRSSVTLKKNRSAVTENGLSLEVCGRHLGGTEPYKESG